MPDKESAPSVTLLPARPVSRYLFHAALAALASPMPGCVLLAVRLLANGRGRESLLVVGAMSGVVALLLGLAFFLPFAARPVGWLLTILSVLSGLGIAWMERRLGMSPRTRTEGERRYILRALLWGVAVAIATIPAAWIIGTMTSRWGPLMTFKPSMQAHILLTAAIWLVPPGIALGLTRAFLGRPFRIVAPFAFATTLPALLLAFGSVGGISELINYLWLTPARTARPVQFSGDASFAYETLLTILFLLAMAEYLCDAGGVRSFLMRTALITGVAFCAFGYEGFWNSSIPVTLRTKAAYRHVAHRDEVAASQSWRWVLQRAPRSPDVCSAAEQGALAALRAGDGPRARWALERLDEQVRRGLPCAIRARVADALLATDLEVQGASEIDVHPVRPETYLNDTWCVFLTALRSALPQESEIRLKNRLQALSDSPDEIDLPRLDGFDDFRIMARLLGTETLVAPREKMHDLLEQGLPVLFREPYSTDWGLAVADFPNSDAVIWLDYSQWDRDRERPLTRTEVRQLVGSEDSFETREGEVLSEVRRLSSASWLQATLGTDGDWVAVLVPRDKKDGTFIPPSGVEPESGDSLSRLWEARHAANKGAYAMAGQIAASLPSGAARDELLGLSYLGLQSMAPHGSERRPPHGADRAAEPLHTGQALERMSPWGLKRFLGIADRVPGLMCHQTARALERLLEGLPHDGERLGRLMALRLAQGREDDVVTASMALANSDGFQTADTLRAIEALAPLAAFEPRYLPRLKELTDRLPPFIVSDKEAVWPRARSSVAPYCAARAALAGSSEATIAWWRRAVDIDPKQTDYWRGLAEALEAVGENDSAARARHSATLVAGAEICTGTTLVTEGRPGL